MVSMGVWILGMRIVVRKRWGRRIWRCCGRQAGGGVFCGAMACLFLFLVSGILKFTFCHWLPFDFIIVVFNEPIVFLPVSFRML